MPKHPETGEDISKPVYDAIIAERQRLHEMEERLNAKWEERLRAERASSESVVAVDESKVRPNPNWSVDYPTPVPRKANTENAGPNLKGCVIVAIFGILTISFGIFAVAMAWQVFVKSAVPAVVVPIAPVPVVPDASFAALVEPIKAKLAYDPAKAFEVQKNYAGFADALEGSSGSRVTDTRVLETVMKAYLADLNDMGGTPVGAEIDAAVGGALGLDKSNDPKDPGWSFKSLDASDRAKLVAVFRAIASAAESVR